MSQSDVLELLYEFGGVATSKEIKELAKKKYPNRTLYTYVSNRLLKLKKWGTLDREKKDGETIWRIKNWEHNIMYRIETYSIEWRKIRRYEKKMSLFSNWKF